MEATLCTFVYGVASTFIKKESVEKIGRVVMGFDSSHLDYVAIGGRIRELRQTHNLSQTDLADQLGITAAGFSLIERGLSKLTLERAVQISKIFHISVDQLLFDENTASIQRVYSSINRYLSSMRRKDLEKVDAVIQVLYKSLN